MKDAINGETTDHENVEELRVHVMGSPSSTGVSELDRERPIDDWNFSDVSDLVLEWTIDEVGSTVETEQISGSSKTNDNDTFGDAESLSSVSGIVEGTMKKNVDEVDMFSFGVSNDDFVSLTVGAICENNGLITAVKIYSPDQEVLYDNAGTGAVCASDMFINVPLTEGNGTYYVKVEDGYTTPPDEISHYALHYRLNTHVHDNDSTLEIAGTDGHDDFDIDIDSGDIVVTFNGFAMDAYTGITDIDATFLAGDDTLTTDASVDVCIVARGNDGADILFGGADDDVIVGGAGDDVIYGQGGDDLLFGGDQDDGFFGGQGTDVAYGGEGNDVFDSSVETQNQEGGDGEWI